MVTKDLAFLQTWSIPQFKANFGVQNIEVKKNESTGKCFFVYGTETGACSKKVVTGEVTAPVISQVCVSSTGDVFYLLHQQGEGGKATTLAVL